MHLIPRIVLGSPNIYVISKWHCYFYGTMSSFLGKLRQAKIILAQKKNLQISGAGFIKVLR